MFLGDDQGIFGGTLSSLDVIHLKYQNLTFNPNVDHPSSFSKAEILG